MRREKGEDAQPSCSFVSIAKYQGVATSNHNRAPPNRTRSIINFISTIPQLSCICKSLLNSNLLLIVFMENQPEILSFGLPKINVETPLGRLQTP